MARLAPLIGERFANKSAAAVRAPAKIDAAQGAS
jgi:hypothetical protein